MTLPSAMRTAIGISDGDLVEVKMSHGKIVLTPKPEVDEISARLAEGLADVKAGRVHSFDSVSELRDFVEGGAEKKSRSKRKAR
ncbi:hypothetical protein F183_A37510 [Bryobacterales bacterium F-183]|nr:hypothetical protein F183_A37510 [Bryobacterales bacterium F-183]